MPLCDCVRVMAMGTVWGERGVPGTLLEEYFLK